MNRREFETPIGTLVYWISERRFDGPVLVFLPGLTADHRLFDKQIEHFEASYDCVVWDAPAHGQSRPFSHEFILDDWAKWLHGILEAEGISKPVLIGQSMGGYVSQVYMDLFPGQVAGFASIDSAPLQREYYAGWELASLKHTRGMYACIPWNMLVDWGAKGNAETEYGRDLMREMMLDFRKDEYCSLAGVGFRILAHAVETYRPYAIDCPAQLMCGEKDAAGFTRRYNQQWAQRSGLPLAWIPNAGHNSNTDNPQMVNSLIEGLLERL